MVVQTSEGVKQVEYLVNTQTKEVKEVNVQVINEELPIVMPKKPVIQVIAPTGEEAKPIVTQIIDNPETNVKNVESIISVTKESVSKGNKY